MNKRINWTVLAVLSFFSPALLALGLGGAVVESYLDQPLNVRVELISKTEAELQSITAGLASAEDFELLGLSRSAINVPLEFEVVTDAAQPYVRITSDLKVNEPVVQVLVEVVWASGRMLREYTLFLDPPTIDSPAPPVMVKPAPVKAPPVESKAPPVTAIQKTTEPEVKADTPPEPRLETPEPEQGTEQAPEETQEPEQETVKEPETKAEPEPEHEPEAADEQYSEDEVYGPVASGQTLWGIAREYSRGSGYSINQTMLAMQRKNPEAFIRDNINSLKRGAILRLPSFNEVSELTSREALLEVLRQEEEVRTGVRSVAPDFSTPTVADSGDYQATVVEELIEPEVIEDEGRLELVPPAEEEDAAEQFSEQVPDQGTSIDAMQEELSRTEEELVNARQENTYLADRIKELEDEARAREEQALTVQDSGLANMESSLEQQREAGEDDAPVAVTPGGEQQAWYAGKTPYIAGIAVVLIALIVWGLRRRSAGLVDAQRSVEVQAISDDAQDILRTLDTDEGESIPEPEPEPEPESEPEPEPEPVLEPVPEHEDLPQSPVIEADEEPTVVLQTPEVPAEPEAGSTDDGQAGQDEDDPEIKLDLARAYLSLGDKEASRSMLDEVMRSGNEAQKAEAQQMLEEL